MTQSPPPTPPIDAVLLNLALELSLEFGPAWLQPIQSRLRARHPDITPAQADELDAFARVTRDWAHGLIARAVNDEALTEQDAERTIRDALPWIDDATFAHLWNQGRYYAWRG